MISAVLFDLDGTLADSAPDLTASANHLRLLSGKPPLPFEMLRQHCSRGSSGLIEAALGMTAEHPEFPKLRQQFLSHYEQLSPSDTRRFEGVTELLEQLEALGLKWGIVTNKHEYLTWPVVEHLKLRGEHHPVICGDTTDEAKPSPKPLLLAAERLGVAAQDCVYVGDDRRDITAGKAAGMKTIAVTWGYSLDQASAAQTDPHAIASTPAEVLAALEQWL